MRKCSPLIGEIAEIDYFLLQEVQLDFCADFFPQSMSTFFTTQAEAQQIGCVVNVGTAEKRE